ncbi:chromosome alignment-maintaining phosphoprotein 1 [Anthonomus grandis grandis]|uniref:chromosome alignment-maintaining phosphoprotein 1 n=1 Tax=Anthonomus grandis grandis TaxID=2921223 RepID=UPI0021666973|nr:chromosome alignment-maintaining phosphoprotein 1 [Anthonomus grandis grandis]
MDFEDDTHYCLKCHATILGLDNYVSHKKESCGRVLEPETPLASQLLPPDEIELKADDFFSSLELRSSSKKPVPSTSGKNFNGILTRSKISATIPKESEPQQSKSGKNVWIGGNQLKDLGTGDNQSKLIKAVANLERRKDAASTSSPPRIVYEDSEDDSEEYDYEDEESSEEDFAPPKYYTGGKWKPSSPVQWNNRPVEREWNVPPPTYTGGKWKPKRPHSPPASYTKGKWKPSIDEDAQASAGGKYPAHYTGGKHSPPSHTRGKWKPEEDPPPSHTKGKWKPAEDDGKHPPPNYTKGKWRPMEDQVSGGKYPPPGYTRGKWKPEEVSAGGKYPPPGHTKGKWKPRCEQDEDDSFIGKGKGKSKLRVECNEISTAEQCTRGEWKPKSELDASLSDPAKVSIAAFEASSLNNKPGPSSSLVSNLDTKTTVPPHEVEEANFPIKIENIRGYSDDPLLRKSSGTVQYWCSPCNRRLASKLVYERHLKSELHFKRSSADVEFDDAAFIKTLKVEQSPDDSFADDLNKKPSAEKKRNRRKIFEICPVCRSKVNKTLIGKHLISHYHVRKGDISTKLAKQLVLDNILSVILESPFQCSVCKFFCNTQAQFLDHWKSSLHITKDQEYQGYYWCSFCKTSLNTTEEMLNHLSSEEHLEVVSVINRSVPIIIKKMSKMACLTCEETFTLNIQLLNHCRELNHDSSNVPKYDKDDYECKECDKKFLRAVCLQRHLLKKHKQHYFFCSVCNLKFLSKLEAKKHRGSSKHRFTLLDKKRPGGACTKRRCEYCDETFPNFMLLKEHLKEVHPEHKVRCPYCGKNFLVSQELANHIRAKACKFPDIPQHTQNAYQCDKCQFSSDSPSELLYHESLMHSEPLIIQYLDARDIKRKPIPKYKCPLCDKFFPKLSLLPHVRQHTKERPYICSTCNASFTKKNTLHYHEKIHKNLKQPQREATEEKKFLCSTCGVGFTRKFILQQHMLTHSGKICRCPEIGCFFLARKMSELQEHLQTHGTEKHFACDLCGYKGKTKRLLSRHMIIHQETKRFSCNVCQFTCRSTSHLKRHVRLHTGAKPYKCPYCDYKCNNMANLRRHILSTGKHPGKSVYECKFCKSRHNYETNNGAEFKKHLILHHREDFGSNNTAATYITGIYEANEDSTYCGDISENVDEPEEITEKIIPKADGILKLDTNEDPVMQPTELENKDRTLDQMLPMFIIPKDDVATVEISAPDAWNLIGRYDVDQTGTLVSFQSEEDEELFREHF